MRCPKCDAGMEPVSYQEVRVARCTQCKGIWFDMLQYEDLLKIKGSESIDSGDASIGKKQNENKEIQCPTCKVSTLKLSDPTHPEVKFEKCPVCHGAYFDAGEFRHLKESPLISLLKKIFNRQ